MASLARLFLETLNDAPASRIFTRRAVVWATVMPRLRVTTTTPTSLKLAFRAAIAPAFCERSMLTPSHLTARGNPWRPATFDPAATGKARVHDGEGVCRGTDGSALQE